MLKFLALILFIPSLSWATELKLLTWNIFMIPAPINFSKQQTRATIIAEQLAKTDYDVIAMQEAFSGRARKKISKALRETHPYQMTLARDKFFRVLNSGVFIVSKYPFNVLDSVYFDSCTNTDCFAAKGSMLIEVELPDNKKIQIASTHMQAWDTPKARTARHNQLAQIKEMLDDHAFDGIPQLLVGDLNIDGLIHGEYDESVAFMEMLSSPLTGEHRGTNGFSNNGCYKTPGGEHAPQWLDHVWLNPRNSNTEVLEKKVRPFFGMIKKKECPLSDHHAIETIISL